MSAIWGVIDFSGKSIEETTKQVFRECYSKCVIDRTEEVSREHVYMGCGIQYFVPQAHQEHLPVAEENTFFTADVVLDNKAELEQKLGFAQNTCPDGEVLYRLFRQEGKQCLNDLLGAYGFVCYDSAEQKVELVLDAVGNRCFYYCVDQERFYFSTLMEPLVKLYPKVRCNDRFLADFLAMDHLFMVNEPEETPIQGIYRLAPAQYVCYDGSRIVKERYWNPIEKSGKHQILRDEEYKERFRALWQQAVKDVLRTEDEVSILLSGGLDSTAVAAVAAPYLKEQGKTLYSYTSVPMKGYAAVEDSFRVEDETLDVLKTAEYYGNISPEFIDLHGKSSWELLMEEFRLIEMPLKSVQNCEWMCESMRRAYQNHSRLILSGGYGNTTISNSTLTVYMNTLYQSKKRKQLETELKQFGLNMRFNCKYAKQQIYQETHTKPENSSFPYGHSYVNRAIADQVGSDTRIHEINRRAVRSNTEYAVYREYFAYWIALRQIGEINTKHSLATGVLLRDPTKDKRIIEFCAGLPMEQFCKNGIDRRLVKEYLADLMPPHVFSFTKKGVQSADLAFRFQKDWEKTRLEWMEIYDRYSDSRYVDTAYAKLDLVVNQDVTQMKNFDLVRHMYTIMVLQYENDITNMSRKKQSDTETGIVKSDIQEKEETQPLISVIVPVYNVEAYLEKCVESICRQTYQNLEILLIDDCSTDQSGELIDQLAKKDDRIQVFHKESNSGVSDTRNVGLSLAKGDFIGFVDSDDWIEPDMYEKLLHAALSLDAEVSCCEFRYVIDGHAPRPESSGQVRVFSGAEMFEEMKTGKNSLMVTPAVFNKLYRRDLLGEIRFGSYPRYEDADFNRMVMERMKKGVMIGCNLYHYVQRKGSLMHRESTAADVRTFIETMRSQNAFAETCMSPEGLRRTYNTYFNILLDQYCKCRKEKEAAEMRRLYAAEIRSIREKEKEAMILNVTHGKKTVFLLNLGLYSPAIYDFSMRVHRKWKNFRKTNHARKN